MTTTNSIPSTHSKLQQYDSPQAIFEGSCPVCGHSLHVVSRHIGGHYLDVPFLTCLNPDGGETHLLERVSDALAEDYRLFCREMDRAYEAWTERLEAETARW